MLRLKSGDRLDTREIREKYKTAALLSASEARLMAAVVSGHMDLKRSMPPNLDAATCEEWDQFVELVHWLSEV